jgi:hypothetical protein
VKRQLLFSRLRQSLQRLELRPRMQVVNEPADTAWHSMLVRIDIEERERRLAAAERALNQVRL